MMTVDTNFGTEADLKAAVVAAGRTPVEETAVPEVVAEPEKKITEQPAKPGEKTPVAAVGSESTPASEPGEKKPQESSQAAPPEPKPTATHGFKSKAEKAQQLVDRLQQDLELEKGSKATLLAKLATAEAELAKLKPAVPAAAADTGPVKPKRPTRAECDYDDERYEAAMDTYDTSMDTYNQAMSQKAVSDALVADRAKQHKDQMEAQQNAAFNQWVERRDTGAQRYPDWQETFEALPEDADFPPDSAARAAVLESENTADLMYYFAKDVLENDGKELQRVSKLGPVAQVREITRLEQKLASQHENPVVETAPAAAVAPVAEPAKPPEKVPAKPKQPAVIVEPIETVGSHSVGTGGQRTLQKLAELAAEGDQEAKKEYWKRRAAGAQR